MNGQDIEIQSKEEQTKYLRPKRKSELANKKNEEQHQEGGKLPLAAVTQHQKEGKRDGHNHGLQANQTVKTRQAVEKIDNNLKKPLVVTPGLVGKGAGKNVFKGDVMMLNDISAGCQMQP